MSTEPAQSVQHSQPARTEPAEKFTTPFSLLVDAVLVIAFFAFMFTVVSPHVPSDNRLFVALWGGGATACMTGVFWLAIQMFRVVLRAQLAAKRAK